MIKKLIDNFDQQMLNAVDKFNESLRRQEELAGPDATASITGSVTIEGTGIIGATVRLSNGLEAHTGNHGQFAFRKLTPGSYKISVQDVPYCQPTRSVVLRDKENRNVEFDGKFPTAMPTHTTDGNPIDRQNIMMRVNKIENTIKDLDSRIPSNHTVERNSIKDFGECMAGLMALLRAVLVLLNNKISVDYAYTLMDRLSADVATLMSIDLADRRSRTDFALIWKGVRFSPVQTGQGSLSITLSYGHEPADTGLIMKDVPFLHTDDENAVTFYASCQVDQARIERSAWLSQHLVCVHAPHLHNKPHAISVSDLIRFARNNYAAHSSDGKKQKNPKTKIMHWFYRECPIMRKYLRLLITSLAIEVLIRGTVPLWKYHAPLPPPQWLEDTFLDNGMWFKVDSLASGVFSRIPIVKQNLVVLAKSDGYTVVTTNKNLQGSKNEIIDHASVMEMTPRVFVTGAISSPSPSPEVLPRKPNYEVGRFAQLSINSDKLNIPVLTDGHPPAWMISDRIWELANG